MESLAAPAPVDSTQHPDFKRPIVNFSPSIWGDVFLQYDSQPMVLLLSHAMFYVHIYSLV